jgi:hypothetical protein
MVAPRVLRRGLQRVQIVYVTVGVLCLSVVVIAAWFALSRPRPQTTENVASDRSATQSPVAKGAVPEGEPLAPPTFTTHSLRVVTPKEPGFIVLVNGEAVRSADGKPVESPCSITLPGGRHRVTVVRKGYHDASEEVAIDVVRGDDNPAEVVLEPEFEPFAVSDAYFKSPFTQAKVGEPIELAALNADGRAYDPCVSADGLTIVFASERSAGRGIYIATRATPFDEFSDAELIDASGGSTPPASPTLTPDGLTMAFVVPDKGRIWTLTRRDVDSPFDKSSDPLKYRTGETEIWRSIQLVDDATKLYCVQQWGSEAACYVATRIADAAGKAKKKTTRSRGAVDSKGFDVTGYGNWRLFPMPGTHPHLSLDGLRQYEYDGKTLTRATRQSTSTAFSPPQWLTDLKLENFQQRADYRQFCVTEDEQWFFYSDDPRENGRLFAARISNGPGWGFVSRGKPLPSSTSIARRDAAPAGDAPDAPPVDALPAPNQPRPDQASKPAAPASADPRTLSLPYVALRKQLDDVLSRREFDAAEKLVLAAQADPAHAADRDVLAWDLDEVRLDLGFWKDLDRAVRQLKPGDTIRLAGTSGEFTKAEDGKIEIKTRARPLEKALAELPAGDLIALVDRVVDRMDEAGQLRVAAFLKSDPKSVWSLIRTRLDKAGVAGRDFAERQAKRRLHVIQLEFARGNVGEGLELIDELNRFVPRSETATQALALRESLYTSMVWRPLGNMKWDTSTPGTFATTEPPAQADSKKKKKSVASELANSYLISPRTFRNFELSLEWKAVGEAAHGGVYFCYAGQNSPRGNSFKIHFANDFAQRANPDRFATGALFGLQKPTTNAVKREGEWNTFVLRVESGRARVRINNVDVLDTTTADSGFPDSGYVCLEGETPGLTYRRVLLYELPGAATTKGDSNSSN